MFSNTRKGNPLSAFRAPAIVLLAAALDARVGDPPNRFHPVAWIGRAIAVAQRRAPRAGRIAPLLYGGALSAAGLAALAGLGHTATRLCRWAPILRTMSVGPLAEAWALKLTFSARGLAQAADEVLAALREPDGLEEARRRLAWHLVSRDTRALSAAQVCSAVIESVAENLCDSVVAPLMAYALGGLPAAWAYRFANTADAMLGYHDAEREWLGKVPARLDDALNLAPARLSALVLLLAGGLSGYDARRGWCIWRRDARLTASPNAGHTMSAMAGLLGVALEKPGHYCLGAGLRQPTPDDVAASIRLLRLAAGLGALLCALLALARPAPGR